MQVNVNEVPFRSDTERPLVLFVLNSMSASSCPHQWTTRCRPLPVHTTSHAPASPLNDDSLRKVLESPLRPTHSSNPRIIHLLVLIIGIGVIGIYRYGNNILPVAEFQIVQTGRHSPYGFARTRPEARQSPATILRRFQNHNALLS